MQINVPIPARCGLCLERRGFRLKNGLLRCGQCLRRRAQHRDEERRDEILHEIEGANRDILK